MKTSLEVLQETREILSHHWDKTSLARHDKSRIVSPIGDVDVVYDAQKTPTYYPYPATAWSILGAILYAESSDWQLKTEAYKYISQAVRERGFTYISDFEDPDKKRGKTTSDDVLTVMDRAITLCKQRENKCN